MLRAIRVFWVVLRRFVPLAGRRVLFRPLPDLALARATSAAFHDLGATYVKFGQLVASSPGIFGQAVANVFRSCLDTGPAVPYPEVRATIESTLESPIDELFGSFEETPFAAASLAVVHRATLRNGRLVAVKVLRPRIERVLAADLWLMRPLLDFLARVVGLASASQLLRMLATLREQLTEELDLRNEVRGMDRYRRLAADEKFDLVAIPEPLPQFTSERVLTMEYLDGIPIDNLSRVKTLGFDPRPLIEQVVRGWFLSLLRDGVFHGDVHAGNVMLLRDGRVGVVDFGIVGHLDPSTHRLYRSLIRAGLGDEAAWDDVATHFRNFYGPVVLEASGLSPDALPGFMRDVLNPVLNEPLAEVRLGTMVSALQGDLGRRRSGAGSVRAWLRRLRAQRRFHARFVETGGLGGMHDRNMYLLGKQLLYFERYGKMFLGDAPLLFDRPFFASLVADEADPCVAVAAPECAACHRPAPAGAVFCPACGARLDGRCVDCDTELPAGARFCPACGGSIGATPAAPRPRVVRMAEVPRTAVGAGRYQIERLLGEGAKKVVYLAHDTRLDRQVALGLIKTDALDAAGLARVRREARAMGRVGEHRHVVTVYDIADEDGQPYIVSQYMSGGDLAHVLGDGKRLPPEQVVRIADQICQALAQIHASGVVHRDLKPGNVWFTGDGNVKLGDFGLAAAIDRSRITEAGMIVGTVAYMPPEQALGRPPEPRSDLYSLGAMLYEMTTGRPPFFGDDPLAVISQHLNTPPVAPSWHNAELPHGLEAVILKLLAKAPEDRPGGAADVRALLAAVGSAPADAGRPASAETMNPLDGLASGVFVGRTAELTELRAAVQDAISGRPRLVLIGGEAGIGKTRTAEEAVTYARLCNAQALWGRCYEGEGAPAFWPWVQAIREYVHDRDAGTLMSEMGSGAGAIAQLVPEVQATLPDIAGPVPLDPEQARFRLFDSVTTFLRNAARRQPIVLVLDDLHWADKPSLLLLQFIARNMRDARLLVIGTYRDVDLTRQHPLTQALGELGRERLSERLVLTGLGENDVGRFIEMTTGVAAPAALVRAVYRETEGNPFFVSEVVRLLASDGRLQKTDPEQSWSVDIPQGIREVIGRRLARLSDDCNRVLTIGAAIGREFEIGLLAHVADQPEDRLLELLDEAVRARVLTETPRAGVYGFTHGLIRETLYEELTLARRVRLHKQIGTVIEQIHADRLDAHLPQLAYHWLQAAPADNEEKAAAYAVRAARRAGALLAYEEALRLYGMALQALELRETPDPRQRCEVLRGLADAQRKAGDLPRAKETLQRAADTARAGGLSEYLADVALEFGAGIGAALGVEFGVHDAQVVRLLEEALEALGEREDALRARLLAALALALAWSEPERRAAVSEEAVAIARRVRNREALIAALTSRHFAFWGTGDPEERLAIATEIVETAQAAGDVESELRARTYRFADLWELGRVDDTDQEREAIAALAERLKQPYYLWWAAAIRVTRPLFEGRFEEAEQLARQALTLGQRAQERNALQFFGSQMFALRWAQGRLDEVVDQIEAFAGQYAAVPAWRCGLAFLYAELGREAAARAEFGRVAARDFADLPVDISWVSAVGLIAQVCAVLDDRARAKILYDRLLPCAERNVFQAAAVALGAVHRSLGLLAATLRHWRDAERHFESAVAFNGRMRAAPFVALTQYNWAAMCLARAADGDRARALELLNAALDTAQKLGMRALVDDALALKLRAQGIGSGDVSTSIDSVVSAVARERPDLRRHAAPDGTVTIMFTDIEGSTAMTERLGDRRAQDVLRLHNAAVREQVAAFAGYEVKSQGDGFMVAFASARRAVLSAVEIQRAIAEQGIRVRIGLHTGETVREADDFFGKNVILSARIANAARGGEILVSSVVKELIESGGDIDFGDRRELTLKGLAGKHVVYPVVWDAVASRPTEHAV